MAELFVTSERVKTRADLPDPLVPGRKYFVEDEGVVLVDWGEGAYQFGGGTGGGGGGVAADVVVDALNGNEADKAPSVRAVVEELDKRPKLDFEGKIPEELLPEGVMKEALYRGPFLNPEALKAAHATDVAGAYASVMSTNTMWLWDGAAWSDTGKDLGVVNVVDSIENNERDKAPSVRAVKELYKNKADLTIDGKIPVSEIPDAVSEKVVVDTLAGAETDKAPSVRAVNAALDSKASLDDGGKIPVSEIPDAVSEKVVVDTLAGAETDKAPSVRAVNAALDNKANLDDEGKIPEGQLPDRLVNDSLYRGAFSTPEALKAAHATDVAGAYASVMSTKTMWLWDGAAWTNTGNTLTGVTVNVVDSHSSTSTKDALSANQGRVLAGLIGTKADESSVVSRLANKSPVGHTHDLTLDEWVGITGLTINQLKLLKTLTPTMDDAGKYLQLVKGDDGYLKFAFVGVPKPVQYSVFNTDGIWIPPLEARNIKFTIVAAGGGGGADYYDMNSSDIKEDKKNAAEMGIALRCGVPAGGTGGGHIYRDGSIIRSEGNEYLMSKTEVHVVVGRGGTAGVDGGKGGSPKGGQGGTTGVYVREYTLDEGKYLTSNTILYGGTGGGWGGYSSPNTNYTPIDGTPGYIPNMSSGYGYIPSVKGTGIGGKIPVLMMPNGMSLSGYGNGGDARKKGDDGIVVIEYTL